MNVATVRLTAAVGDTVTLGELDYATGRGFTLDRTVLNAARRVVFASNLPLVTGGVVAPGRLQTRLVRFEGLVVAPTDRQAHELARELVTVLRDRGTDPVAIAYTPEVDELELTGHLTGAVEFEPEERGPWLRYMFEMECADPIAKGEQQQQSIDTPITNAGNADVWPDLTITLSGTVTSVRIGSTTTGDFIQLNGLAGTETLIEITSAPGFEQVKVDGAPAMDKLTTATVFFPLTPGENNLYVTALAGGGSATAEAEWRDGYLL
jgi:hypothetical protein